MTYNSTYTSPFVYWKSYGLCHVLNLYNDLFMTNDSMCAPLNILCPNLLNSLIITCRWGNIPVDDALQFGHEEVATLIKDYQQDWKRQEKQHSKAEHPQKLDTIEGMV